MLELCFQVILMTGGNVYCICNVQGKNHDIKLYLKYDFIHAICTDIYTHEKNLLAVKIFILNEGSWTHFNFILYLFSFFITNGFFNNIFT